MTATQRRPRTIALAHAATIPGMDILLVLVVVLILVIMWRGPKTLPLIGRAFGQGVKEAKKEIDAIKDDTAAPEDETKSS